VDGGDYALFFFHKNDRQAVGRLDNQKKAGEACNRGITPQPSLRHLVDEMNDIGVHLLQEKEFEIQPIRELPKVFLSPYKIAEPVPEKGKALELRNFHHR
jgi:hypothetical protein